MKQQTYLWCNQSPNKIKCAEISVTCLCCVYASTHIAPIYRNSTTLMSSKIYCLVSSSENIKLIKKLLGYVQFISFVYSRSYKIWYKSDQINMFSLSLLLILDYIRSEINQIRSDKHIWNKPNIAFVLKTKILVPYCIIIQWPVHIKRNNLVE